MKSVIGFLLFCCGLAHLAASLECPACDLDSCPYGLSETIGEDGCPTCACLTCEDCSSECLFGFTDYDTEGCPDCSSCLKKPAGSCTEVECYKEHFFCNEIQRCNTDAECVTEARCTPKILTEFWCSHICPLFTKPNQPFAAECEKTCKKSHLSLCSQANCKENEHCELEKLTCPANELCKAKAVCVPNNCSYPMYCPLECKHGLKRLENKCPQCECKIPSCKDITCKDDYLCVEKEVCLGETDADCYQEAKCIPATCENVQCASGFICKQEDIKCVSPPCTEALPKCVLETCDNIDCGNEFDCIHSTEGCSLSVCPKCVPHKDCSKMTCKPGTVCKIIKPECPECTCSEGMSPDCVPNSEGCDKDCEKPYATCAPNCKEVECPANCKFGCLKTVGGCLTTICAPPSDCDSLECKTGEICQVTTPDCDSEGPCASMIATCVKYCPDLSCTKSHDICPWGMKLDSNGCPTCECNKPDSCDQIKCHADNMCRAKNDEISCQSCGIVECPKECPQGQERMVDHFGCTVCDCTPSDVCEDVTCSIGKECIVQKLDCKQNDTNCQSWKTKCVCIQQDCHKFCENGFKKNPLTGCDTCECNDDLPTCEDIKCPTGKTCVVSPTCTGSGCPLPKPVCVICPKLELCPQCNLGFRRDIDDNGCKTCKCIPDCGELFCDINCGPEGHEQDASGCPTCKCNPTEVCEGFQCPDEYECRQMLKKGKLFRFCKGAKKIDVIPTPI
ncbi:DgyrCDS3821 [Dimorphilus gyrociliatus]|uniref:DgyrCDS3821 n=1 Tax=Dimorphilus gyrociliatus TaxID=2664684 RepID=A0A7I8VF17_9ANNE|nr:DgyrCDS3821 [Dimorphilus gyrociliatus]